MKGKELMLENFNVFKACIIERFLIPKWKATTKATLPEDDEIELLIELSQGMC